MTGLEEEFSGNFMPPVPTYGGPNSSGTPYALT